MFTRKKVLENMRFKCELIDFSGSCKDPPLADGRAEVGEVNVFSSWFEKGINPPQAPSFLPHLRGLQNL